MDLSVLHRHPLPDRDYSQKDKLNSLTGHLDCRFLEWTGWYNQDIYQRLLGHYRLYQLFKKENKAENELPQPLAYIVNYPASHGLKYMLSRVTSIVYYLGSFGKPYYPLQTQGMNKLLINENASILQGFLSEADSNFERAFARAIAQIATSEFERKPNALYLKQSIVILQTRNEFNNYHNSTQYFNEYTTVNTAISGIKGKEKGVFSKKQILILFDLLAESGKVERIDFSRPNKFDSIADLLFAITGKSKDSWIEQLKDGRNKGLYEFKSDGERKQLIATLTNLSEVVRKAGFRSVSKIADKKIIDFEKREDFCNSQSPQ